MWYFVAPQIVFGVGALSALDEIRGERALIVTDRHIVGLGLVERVRQHLATAGIESVLFDTVEPDPDLETVRRGAAAAHDYAPDWIIGVGGGSALDAAKAIWVLYERPDLDPAEISPLIELGLRKKARLITIPTTSGTGSEVTWAIVLTDPEERRKLGLGNRENVADLAIVDPEMVISMPPRLTADTGLDALTHAVEGYTCTWHTDMTDGICLQAARMVLKYLPLAYADGQDWEARERMHNAATLAGLGFGNALASMAHALGHALGAVFHVPHGRAVGLFLPYTIEFIAEVAPERFADIASVFECGCADPREASRDLAAAIRQLCQSVESPTRIADLGIARSVFEVEIDRLVDHAFNDSSLMTAARSPSYEELARLFWYAFDGKEIDF